MVAACEHAGATWLNFAWSKLNPHLETEYPRALVLSTLVAAVLVGLVVRQMRRAPAVQEDRLVVLPRHLLYEAATVAARAFAESPAFVYVAGQDADSFEVLRWLFYRNFWLRASTRTNRAIVHKGELIAFFMFVGPDVRSPTLLDMISAGLLRMPLLFGVKPVKRLFKLMEWFDDQDMSMTREYGHMYHLERVCVRPEFQGQGVGTEALRAALAEADARGIAVFLATQSQRNVAFYTRLGFEVVRTATFEGYSEPNRFMVRRPRRAEKTARGE